MVKPQEKSKTNYTNLLITGKDVILKKELDLIIRDDTVDVTYLRINNDNDFVLKPKEKTHRIPSNKCYPPTKFSIKPLRNETNNSEEKHAITNEIFDIKCIQKTTDEVTETMRDDINHDCKSTTADQEEIIANPPKSPVFTNDLKSDLKSLLVLMALSSSYNDGEKLNHTPYEPHQTHDCVNTNVDKDNSKQQIKNTRPSEAVCTDNEISNILKIEALQNITYHNNSIIRKYAQKWMNYVKIQRQKRSHRERLANINKFLERLEKKKHSVKDNVDPVNKAKSQARDYNTYQHRYKIQKHIIALQKAKLEQQNRLIDELKYNKIIETSRQSLDNMKKDIKQTYYDIDKHLKPKIKCLTNELKIPEIEESSLILHCLKVPQFLQRMEARAREREEKHAIIRERRKQMEEERIRLKQQAEIAKAEMDKEEKLKRMKELREKRKREKIENIRKKQHAERLRALIVMADLHYERSLMAKYGIRPLKLLIQLKRDNMEKAKAHYQFQLMKNIFLHWMWHTEDMWYERNYKAEDFYRKKLLKKTFDCLKKNHNEYLIKLQVARDYYDLYVTQLVFKQFKNGILIIKKEFDKKWNNAIVYYNSNLLFKTLTCWRTLPALNALKREQDARKLRWREKVLQVVPDYVPPEE